MKRRLLLIAIAALAAYVGADQFDLTGGTPSPATASRSDTAAVFDASDDERQIRGTGTVVKILPDDNKGSRHQRFILELASGQTLLVAHNIDLAPRIADLEEGDTVAFNGEYADNARGGVVHWTHHDPQGRHAGGWLKHEGQTYE